MDFSPQVSRPLVEHRLSTFNLVLCPMLWQHDWFKRQFSRLSLTKLEHWFNNEFKTENRTKN